MTWVRAIAPACGHDVSDVQGDWRSAGEWTMSTGAWRQGHLGAIFDELEPLEPQ